MTYTWDDILIVGDSFCWKRSNLKKGDWPIVLSNLLTGDVRRPRGAGVPGSSWWMTRKILLEEVNLRMPKVLILCHTEKDRIVNDYNYGIDPGIVSGHGGFWENVFVDKQNSPPIDKIKNAAIDYYNHLYSPEYQDWTYNRWRKEVDVLLYSWKIPCVIHLNSRYHHTYNYGTTSDEILTDNAPEFSTAVIYHRNHFPEELNKRIGHQLYNAVLNYNTNDRLKNLNLFKDNDELHT